MVFFVFSVGLMMMEVVDRVRRISLEKINLEKGRMILEASDGRKHSYLDNRNAQCQYKAST